MTTEEDFTALLELVKNNKIADIKKMLETFDVTATNSDGWNVLMMGSFASNPEVMKIIVNKILAKNGGPDLMKRQLTASMQNGFSALMMVCANPSSSSETITLIFDKTREYAGKQVLQYQLCEDTDEDLGLTCLLLACSSATTGNIRLLLEQIVHLGGGDLLRAQLVKTDRMGRNCFACSFSSEAQSKETLLLISALLHHFELFKQQYATLPDEHKKTLKEKANINDESWVPNSANVAEVKAIVEGRSVSKQKKSEETGCSCVVQ